jgi:hypothetical protein
MLIVRYLSFPEARLLMDRTLAACQPESSRCRLLQRVDAVKVEQAILAIQCAARRPKIN